MTVYLLAHGSADPRHARDVEAIARRLSSTLVRTVRPCFLDLCPPTLAQAAVGPGVVVPLLLSPGYHASVDVAREIAGASHRLSRAEPPLLTGGAAWGSDLLAEVRADWPGRRVVAVTAGTRDPAVLEAWDETSEALGIPVFHASGPGPRPHDLDPQDDVVLPLLAARGIFADLIATQVPAVPVTAVAGASAAIVSELAGLVRRAG